MYKHITLTWKQYKYKNPSKLFSFANKTQLFEWIFVWYIFSKQKRSQAAQFLHLFYVQYIHKCTFLTRNSKAM